MIPIKDGIRPRTFPFVNLLLILANIGVYGLQWLSGPYQEELVYTFALIPAEFSGGFSPGGVMDIFTSMFMHGSLLHIGGNMLYLWIFGDNVEDSMGHLKYLIFYLIGGVGAAMAHIFFNPNSVVPTVGASGAIAAVLGAYLVLYPRSRVLTLIPLGIFFRFTTVPAIIVLGMWFVLQLFNGMFTLGGPDAGGVAFWAHIGGFVVGMILAKLFANRAQGVLEPEWD